MQLPVGVGDEVLVYQNTLGTSTFSLGETPNDVVGDDVVPIGAFGCSLARFRFRVVDKFDAEGEGGPYRIDFALYKNCPNLSTNPDSAPATAIIPGTAGFVELNDGDQVEPRDVEFVVPDEVTATLPSSFWLGIRASRPNVGIIGGAPAMRGFSTDRYDAPGSACTASPGGFPEHPHGSFYLEVFARPGCATTFPTYANRAPEGLGFNEGARKCFADDVELQTSESLLTGYEIAIRLSNNTATATYRTRLHEDAGGIPGPEVPGTAKAGQILTGPGSYRIVLSLSNPVLVHARRLWVTFEPTTTGAGWIVTGHNHDLGGPFGSAPFYARSKAGQQCATMLFNPDWEVVTPPADALPGPFAAFDVTLHCAGEPPAGACCDSILNDATGEAVCRDVPRMNCPDPQSWQEGAVASLFALEVKTTVPCVRGPSIAPAVRVRKRFRLAVAWGRAATVAAIAKC